MLLKIENAVFDLIFKASPESTTVKTLVEATGEPSNAVRTAAKELVKKGHVIRRNGPNNTALYFLAITDNSSDDSDDASTDDLEVPEASSD